ncbi:hypothetical protein [Actinoplanes auranticolor]|uniref:Uncharacterized protein n=1 Tax=Actinoplanes auranticolor TaxID=47988 RepID=A0A919VQQ0_9ACTN|nr:hypothetical protein [Actinoplanes auranticolor]GIM75174.1 hypothetical protein Aau02nite_64590 [Actinoplanes auranticolor]
MPETGEAVVAFGPDDDDEAERPPRRRAAVGEFLTGLAGDRRVVPIAAALGAVALFGSLVSEWQLTEIDGTYWGDGEVGTRSAQTTLADLDGWSGGYLTGLFLLVAATVLTLFGPPAGRRYARLAALSVGGTLLATVVAIGSYLGDISGAVGQLTLTNLEENQVTVSNGRGLWCAGVGVALVLLAMVLAGRHQATGPGSGPVDAPPDEAQPVEVEAPAWTWRRPATGDEDEPPDAPFDLTVTAAKPFTTSQENTDKPS